MSFEILEHEWHSNTDFGIERASSRVVNFFSITPESHSE